MRSRPTWLRTSRPCRERHARGYFTPTLRGLFLGAAVGGGLERARAAGRAEGEAEVEALAEATGGGVAIGGAATMGGVAAADATEVSGGVAQVAGRSSRPCPSVKAAPIATTTPTTKANTYRLTPRDAEEPDFAPTKLADVEVDAAAGRTAAAGRGIDGVARTVSASGEISGGGSEPPKMRATRSAAAAEPGANGMSAAARSRTF